ncbi:hypothetical protein SteCoe_37318 [Stentor coeruleus]|uniref:Uncharacterized protein n=1 Tax=Stentor coeruleus TaxID=5963 RepID=A0A1R2AN78_9CILI|nr:hypothetical protein SteCoe_37318 [Stentor coeruleus]
MSKYTNFCHISDENSRRIVPAFHPEIAKPIPIQTMINNDQNFTASLFKMLLQQNELVKSLVQDTKAALEKITDLTIKKPKEASHEPLASSEETITPSVLLRFLTGDNRKFTHKIELEDELPSPAYKERTFSVLANIVDMNGNKVQLADCVKFKIMLYTADSPPKMLNLNTSGDKIMRGTLEVEGSSSIFFKKVIVKEVTSHFRNGCFFFVIVPEGADYIKPLIAEDFVIKARKITSDCPKKKQKTQEDDF